MNQITKRNNNQIRAIAPTSNELDLTQVTKWNRHQIDLLKSQIAKDCSDAELALFGEVCDRTGLNPFLKQIYAISRNDKESGGKKMSIQTGIDGFRLIAERTGVYAGSDEALFDEGLNLYEHLKSDRGAPKTAKVTVWKMVQGQRCPFTAVAAWDEYVQTNRYGSPNSMWSKMPHNQLGKVAEAAALRKAFPAETSGLSMGEPPQINQYDSVKIEGFRGSKAWTVFEGMLKRSQSADQVQQATSWAHSKIASGDLPKNAASIIDNEALYAAQRLSDRTVAPSELIPVEVDAEVMTEEDEFDLALADEF